MSTPNLGMPTVPTGTLEPSIPMNDALQLLDAVVPGVVQEITATPPTTISGDAGKVWIVGGSATGAWAGHDDDLAISTGADLWRFITPQEGWRFHNLDDGDDYRLDSGVWTAISSGGGAANIFVNIALSDMTTDLTTGTAKGAWFAPENGTLVDVWIGLHDPSSSGIVRIDMNNSGGSVLTTRPSIDATEATSLTGTAAVLDGTVTFSKGDKFTFDIDDAGTDAKGLQAVLEYTPA